MLLEMAAIVASTLIGPDNDDRPRAIGLPESRISAIASTDDRIRDAALSELLRDGPVRLEEIEQASDALQQVLRMHRRLTTPHIDWRAGHRVKDEQLAEAADYFLRLDAIPWLLDGLENEDLTTRWIVATTLPRMSPRASERYRRLIVARCSGLLSDTSGQSGDATMDRDVRYHLSVLTARLIESPIADADRDQGDWRRIGFQMAEQADVWLAREGERR